MMPPGLSLQHLTISVAIGEPSFLTIPPIILAPWIATTGLLDDVMLLSEAHSLLLWEWSIPWDFHGA